MGKLTVQTGRCCFRCWNTPERGGVFLKRFNHACVCPRGPQVTFTPLDPTPKGKGMWRPKLTQIPLRSLLGWELLSQFSPVLAEGFGTQGSSPGPFGFHVEGLLPQEIHT